VKDSELKPGQQYATMSDDLIMVHAAVELGKQVGAAADFHLRLLLIVVHHRVSSMAVLCLTLLRSLCALCASASGRMAAAF
jgi:hypothetical protein